MPNREITKWAVIWKRDSTILSFYGLKKTDILSIEAKETTGDSDIINTYAIFDIKKEAKKWQDKNKDWEVVKCKIMF